MNQANTQLIVLALKTNYRKMIDGRLRKKSFVRITTSDNIIGEVAVKLGDLKLAALFIEAQFAGLPSNFCKMNFNRLYPPSNVVFGGKCWERYKTYVERGIRDAT